MSRISKLISVAASISLLAYRLSAENQSNPVDNTNDAVNLPPVVDETDETNYNDINEEGQDTVVIDLGIESFDGVIEASMNAFLSSSLNYPYIVSTGPQLSVNDNRIVHSFDLTNLKYRTARIFTDYNSIARPHDKRLYGFSLVEDTNLQNISGGTVGEGVINDFFQIKTIAITCSGEEPDILNYSVGNLSMVNNRMVKLLNKEIMQWGAGVVSVKYLDLVWFNVDASKGNLYLLFDGDGDVVFNNDLLKIGYHIVGSGGSDVGSDRSVPFTAKKIYKDVWVINIEELSVIGDNPAYLYFDAELINTYGFTVPKIKSISFKDTVGIKFPVSASGQIYSEQIQSRRVQ